MKCLMRAKRIIHSPYPGSHPLSVWISVPLEFELVGSNHYPFQFQDESSPPKLARGKEFQGIVIEIEDMQQSL